jgi:hypothetical protein
VSESRKEPLHIQLMDEKLKQTLDAFKDLYLKGDAVDISLQSIKHLPASEREEFVQALVDVVAEHEAKKLQVSESELRTELLKFYKKMLGV